MTTIPISARRACALTIALLIGVGTTGCALPPTSSESDATAAPPQVPQVAQTAAEAASNPAASVVVEDTALDDTALDPVPAAPRTMRSRLDPTDDAAHVDLWARVRVGYTIPAVDNDLVRKWEQWYASRPDYVQRMSTRGGRYLFHIVEEIHRRGMPVDLALLPFVESAFNPQARSSASAAGMWQFMPLTGRDFELRQNVFRDDRRDVLASTRAALDYLQRLYDQFGDWQVALAAYNWGQGNLQKAIARNQKAGLPTDYESLRLPDETRNYLPKLQAVKNIVQRPADFGLALPPLENHPFFLSVQIERDIDVALAAQLSGLPLDEFQQLNPQMNKPVILAAGTSQVLLPYDNANRFLRELERYRGPLASWTAWVVPKTLKPADAARQTGMSEEQLREVNLIPTRMLVKAGSTLLVPRSAQVTDDVAEHIADNATMQLAPDVPPLRKVTVRAGKKGETVAALARRYRVSAAQVAHWNDVAANGRFKGGQSVVLMLAAAPTGSAAATRAPSASATSAPRAKAVSATTQTAQRKSTAPAARASAKTPPATKQVATKKSAPSAKVH